MRGTDPQDAASTGYSGADPEPHQPGVAGEQRGTEVGDALADLGPESALEGGAQLPVADAAELRHTRSLPVHLAERAERVDRARELVAQPARAGCDQQQRE